MENDLKQLELKVERLEFALRTLINWSYELGKENQILLQQMINGKNGEFSKIQND